MWMYASLAGSHDATQVARALKTDLAHRSLSGGHAFGETVVHDFRRKNRAFFQRAVQQRLAIALERGLVDPSPFAIDSVRLRAEASTKSTRTSSRSEKRLEERAAADVTQLSEAAQAAHAEKVAKHTAAGERCEAEGRTSHDEGAPHLLRRSDAPGRAQGRAWGRQ